MRLALLELSCPDTRGLGVRGLASYLESRGHTCQLIFLPPSLERMRAGVTGPAPYSARLLGSVIEACRGADLVGLSMLSYYFDLGVQITAALRRETRVPVIWGGYHTTGAVERSLEHADYACVGEGEEMLAGLLDAWAAGRDGLDTPNLAYKRAGELVRNPLRPLIQDLDTLPFLDYRLDAHLVTDPRLDELAPLDYTRARQLSLMGMLSPLGTYHHYQTFISRGCPNQCAYCCESLIHELYRGQRQMRRRSPDNLADEMDQVRRQMDFIDCIAFSDDSIAEATDEEIESFAAVYGRRIGLPFHAQFSPKAVSRRKLDALVAAGLVSVSIGIQSGSPRTRQFYRRGTTNEEILEVSRQVHAYRDRIMPPDYHFIVDNPWDTTDDVLETLRLVARIPKPRRIMVSSLVLYPGTDLYRLARQEGRIRDEVQEVYRKAFGALEPVPANLLLFASDAVWMPNWLLAALSRRWLVERRGPGARWFVQRAIRAVVLSRRVARKLVRIGRQARQAIRPPAARSTA